MRISRRTNPLYLSSRSILNSYGMFLLSSFVFFSVRLILLPGHAIVVNVMLNSLVLSVLFCFVFLLLVLSQMNVRRKYIRKQNKQRKMRCSLFILHIVSYLSRSILTQFIDVIHYYSAMNYSRDNKHVYIVCLSSFVSIEHFLI
jgi:hypothetical protein